MTDTLTWFKCAELFIAADPSGKFVGWKSSQTNAYNQWEERELHRMLLFFPTGEGKSQTALALLAVRGHKKAFVIAPPGTHLQWEYHARALGMELSLMSVQKFRMKDSRIPRGMPWIIDEFHQLGGRDGAGWKKVNRMMNKFENDLIMASATPNYNDAERVFCLTAIGERKPVRNYEDWLYANCETRPNRWKYYPDVVCFKGGLSAIEFLRVLPWVAYVEDTAKWTPKELKLSTPELSEFEEIGLSRRDRRIMASDMEARHKRVDLTLIDDDGYIRLEAMDKIIDLLHWDEQWIVFAFHANVVEALSRTFREIISREDIWTLTSATPKSSIPNIKDNFIRSERGVLIGTTALATGIDGLDKTCHNLLILDDIEGDHSLRRQLIGRILARGVDEGHEKTVVTASFT